MADYPSDEIERIIQEEILRGHNTSLWTQPQARRRYQQLLAGLVVQSGDSRGKLLADVFDAQYELAPYCTTRERMFVFTTDALVRLRELLRILRTTITAVLNARDSWPQDSRMSHDDGAAFLEIQLEQLQDELERSQQAHATGKSVGLHSGRAVTLDETLQVCKYLLLTTAESDEFDEHYGHAQQQMRNAGPLFHMPANSTLQ